MRIAVMGAGAVGSTLGQRRVPHHDVVFGVRDPLRIARLLEPTAMLGIHLALFQGLGPQFAFGLLRQ